MQNKVRIDCFNELSKLITTNQLKFDDINEISDYFFSKYVNLLHVGKIDIVSNVPKTIYEQQLFENTIVAYDSNNFGDNYIIKESEVTSTNNGSTKILIYPTKGYCFKEDESEFIFSIVSLFHLYFSKKRLENLIEETRCKDSLTNIYNMNGLNKFFNQMKSVDNYVYVFSNIKNFKYINTIFKKNDADMILKKYANELFSLLNKDEAICRPGGDNFISVVKRENFKQYLEKLQHVTVEIDESNVDLYSTIGYYENIEGLSPNTSVELASTAYGIAKRNNMDIFKYNDELNKQMIKEKTIKFEISNAIKNGELVIYYQPKVNSEKNELCGAESLIRWNRDGKMLMPGEFIDILEKENLIIELDYYILAKTCENIKMWQESGLEPVKVSVNFSMKHLNYDDTAKRILSIIKEYNIDTKYIEIELTELTDITNIKKMEKFIETLQKNNISVSMDDFGSGYSSMTLLKKLNYDMVKIDKELIDSLEKGNEKNLIILRNIISMLKELNIDVIAEGVESKKQLEILKEYGCKNIQGYYYDKPLCDSDFIKRLKNKTYI